MKCLSKPFAPVTFPRWQKDLLILLAWSLISPVARAEVECPPGRYTVNGVDCIDAEPGFYVPTSGATSQTPAEPGYFISDSGASAPTPAPAGFYVPVSAATSAFAAEPGHYVPDEGASAQIAAEPGFFVSEFGSTAPSIAPPGKYVSGVGATAAMDASPGHYVPAGGATAPIPADPGHYVYSHGASAQTEAAPGHYVAEAGATAQVQAEPGRYVPTSGATATMIAEPGYYVPDFGAENSLIAPEGSYVESAGASFAKPARPGYFVPTAGSTAETAAPAGYYVPSFGASSALSNPDGTWSHVASVAARVADSTVEANGDNIVSPVFDSNYGKGETIHLGNVSGPVNFILKISNSSGELGFPDDLTRLSLLNQEIEDTFLVSNAALPQFLEEAGMTEQSYTLTPPSGSNQSTRIKITTDQDAPFGKEGTSFRFDVLFSNVTPTDFSSFSTVNFTAEELGMPSISGFDADVDDDGLKNGLEYVFWLNPRINESSLSAAYLPVSTEIIEDSITRFAMVFSLPDYDFPDVTLFAEARFDLADGPWETLAEKHTAQAWSGPAEVRIDPPADGRVAITVFDTETLSSPDQRFYRLRAVQN